MKRYLFLLVFPLFINACQKDDSTTKVDADGFTQAIKDLVSQDIFDKLELLGMPIYGGDSPPLIIGTYKISPIIILESTIAVELAGTKLNNAEVFLSGPRFSDCTISCDYRSPDIGGEEVVESYYVGTGRNFTVFSERRIVNSTGISSSILLVISGELAEGSGGFSNLHIADFMLDSGEGRVAFDQDGFSEKI